VDCANKRPSYATVWRPINYPRREKKERKRHEKHHPLITHRFSENQKRKV
jgi:hypothetical protein